jgi:hypothetical protein
MEKVKAKEEECQKPLEALQKSVGDAGEFESDEEIGGENDLENKVATTPEGKNRVRCKCCEWLCEEEGTGECFGCKNTFHFECLRLWFERWEEEGVEKVACGLRENKIWFITKDTEMPAHMAMESPDGMKCISFNVCDVCCKKEERKSLDIDYNKWAKMVASWVRKSEIM